MITEKERRVCVGQIMGPHGVKGLVRLRSFTEDPQAIALYKPLRDEEGKILALTIKSAAKDFFIASVEGIESRESAEAARGAKFYVDRALLPETQDNEFYEADLIGLEAVDSEAKNYGTVLAVHNYGAGTFLEIGTNKKDSFMLPFNDAYVPEIHADEKRVRIVVPEGWLANDKKTNHEMTSF